MEALAAGSTPETTGTDAIKGLMWYFDAYATSKGEGFESGVYRLKDSGKVVDFIKKAADKYCYKRISSHFKEQNKPQYKDRQFGIDFPDGDLPHGRRTILFADLKDKTSFKMESSGFPPLTSVHGLAHGIKEFISHSFSFIATRFEASLKEKINEKNIYQKNIKKLCNSLIKNNKEQKQAIEKAMKLGVTDLSTFLKQPSSLNISGKQELQKHIQVILDRAPQDSIIKGDEFIIPFQLEQSPSNSLADS